MIPKYEVRRSEVDAGDGTGRTIKAWAVVNEDGIVATFTTKWEATDYADEMNRVEERV